MIIIERIETPNAFSTPCQCCPKAGEFRIKPGSASVALLAGLAEEEQPVNPTELVFCLDCFLDLRDGMERFKGFDMYGLSISRGPTGKKHIEIVVD
jgi:hypothetical protein